MCNGGYFLEKNIILVPHTYRKSIHIELQDVNLMLLFDGFKNKNNNEDPYIFSDSFLYSFCHAATSMSKNVLLDNVRPIYIFMTKDEDNHYMIDTVIESETIIEWPLKGDRSKEQLKRFFAENLGDEIDIDDVIDHHLPGISEEKNDLTEHCNITLRTCIGNKEGSYLPLIKYGEKYKSFTFNKEYSQKIQNLFKTDKNAGNSVVKKSTPRICDDSNKMKDYDDVIQYIESEVLNNDNIYKVDATKIKGLYSELKSKRGKKGPIELKINKSLNEL